MTKKRRRDSKRADLAPRKKATGQSFKINNLKLLLTYMNADFDAKELVSHLKGLWSARDRNYEIDGPLRPKILMKVGKELIRYDQPHIHAFVDFRENFQTRRPLLDFQGVHPNIKPVSHNEQAVLDYIARSDKYGAEVIHDDFLQRIRQINPDTFFMSFGSIQKGVEWAHTPARLGHRNPAGLVVTLADYSHIRDWKDKYVGRDLDGERFVLASV